MMGDRPKQPALQMKLVALLACCCAAVTPLSARARTLGPWMATAGPPLPVPRPPFPEVRPNTRVAPVDALPPVSPGIGPVGRPAPGVAAAQGTSDCVLMLKAQNVAVETTTVGLQTDTRCTVANPVRLGGLRLADGSTVTFPDKPTIACATFSAFVRDLLVPLAKGSYGSPVNEVSTGPGLECRTRDHIVGAKLSAHAQGLAVDIAEFRLVNGRRIAVGRPLTDLDRSFETAARAGGCGYFHTSLGPGSDPFHETHWHFDLLPRGTAGDAKLCQ